MPKLSIVVPVYNVEKYLDECLESLINQTLRDIEIILVDDKSSDNCPSKCDQWAKKDRRISVIHKLMNEGLGFARNTGMECASGDYIAFCDSDDYLDLDAYEIAYNCCIDNNLDVLGFWYNRFSDAYRPAKDDGHKLLRMFQNKNDIRKCSLSIFGEVPGYDTKNYYITGSACMALYRRSVIETNKIRFKSERQFISEDFLFNFEFLQYVERAGRCENEWYHYRVNATSLTNVVKIDRLEKCEYFAKYLERLLKEYGYNNDASLFSMASYIAALRYCQKSILTSNLELKVKRKWFMESIDYNFIERICKEFPIKYLPFPNRVSIRLTRSRCFWAVMVYFEMIKQIKK